MLTDVHQHVTTMQARLHIIKAIDEAIESNLGRSQKDILAEGALVDCQKGEDVAIGTLPSIELSSRSTE